MHVGMDYGSKYHETTSICYLLNNELVVHQSAKNENDDEFFKGLNQISPHFIKSNLSSWHMTYSVLA